jgi:glutamine amidotransferase
VPVPKPCYARAAIIVSDQKTKFASIELIVCTNRYYSTEAGTTLNRKYPDNPDGNTSTDRFTVKAAEDHGKHIIIASEPSTYKADDWHLIPRNSLVTASEEHGVHVKPISYNPEWDAEDPSIVDS